MATDPLSDPKLFKGKKIDLKNAGKKVSEQLTPLQKNVELDEELLN